MIKTIDLTLKIWRQKGPDDKGRLETYTAKDISVDMSFLEMLDVINEQLTLENKEPIAFDHDCREGICGMCGAVVNGRPHGHDARSAGAEDRSPSGPPASRAAEDMAAASGRRGAR